MVMLMVVATPNRKPETLNTKPMAVGITMVGGHPSLSQRWAPLRPRLLIAQLAVAWLSLGAQGALEVGLGV